MSEIVTRESYQAALDEIHLEIGRSITEWSIVEEFLFDLYALLVTEPNFIFPLGLSISFNSIKNFQTKIDMIDSLIKEFRKT